MANRSVVRNQAYQKKGISIRERHNERENEIYYNADIQQDRKHLNVYFRQSEDSYAQTFDGMITDGTISVKGLKKDGTAKIFDELVFDVNTEYFDRNGGYEYAKSFFEEAYRYTVEEIGGEQYILSAIMHADERNKSLSEQLGRDVYHYHLHVVYVPVVDKEVYFQKSHKNPELAGKLKEVIKQVSHSKKWPRYKTEKGWVNSYSLLQDRFHEHMKEAGYIGFERGERGSTAEHLSTEEYKTQKEKERAAAYTAVVEEKQETAAVLDTVIEGKEKTAVKLDAQAEKKQKQLDGLNEKTAVTEKVVAEIEEIEKLGHKRTILGAVTVPDIWWKKILNLVKETFKSRREIKELKSEIKNLKGEVKSATEAFEQQKTAYIRLVERVQPYLDAVKLFPQQVKEALTSFIQMGRKQQEQQKQSEIPVPERTAPKHKRSNDTSL